MKSLLSHILCEPASVKGLHCYMKCFYSHCGIASFTLLKGLNTLQRVALYLLLNMHGGKKY